MIMETLNFKTEAEAINSVAFKTKDYARVLRNMNRQDGDADRVVIEKKDFGTHLSHQDIIAINFDRIN